MKGALCDSHGCEGVHEHRNRYCGSRFPHPPHTGPMIGNEAVWFDCKGKASPVFTFRDGVD